MSSAMAQQEDQAASDRSEVQSLEEQVLAQLDSFRSVKRHLQPLRTLTRLIKAVKRLLRYSG